MRTPYDTILSESVSDYLMKERKIYKQAKKNYILSQIDFPKKPNYRGMYRIIVPCGDTKKYFTSKSLDVLKDKVYDFIISGCELSEASTMKEVFEKVCDNKLRYIKDEEKILSCKETIKRNRQQYDRFISGTFVENIMVSEITKKDLENLTELNLKKYDLKPKAFKSYRGLLKSIFKLAYEEYIIQDNVYERVDFDKFKNMLVSETDIRKRSHSPDEVDAIICYLKSLETTDRKMVKDYEAYHGYISIHTILCCFALELQIECGMRRGEVPPLRWDDVKKDCLHINKMLQFQSDTNTCQIVHHTKNYKNRIFPMTDNLKDILNRLRDFHKEYSITSEFLFPDEREDSGCINIRAVYRIYQKSCKHLGYELSHDFTKGTHSFRRNAITNFTNASNGNILLASEIYGNSEKCATDNYYIGANLVEALKILSK